MRLKFGHHSGNHPVKDLDTGRVMVTSQNHNYAVSVDSLDSRRVEVTHLSLNDGTLEGIQAALVIHGDVHAGNGDVLDLDDSGETDADSGESTDTQVSGLGMTVPITYAAIESLSIHLGQLGDDFTIVTTHTSTPTTVHGGPGADRIAVHPHAAKRHIIKQVERVRRDRRAR